VLRERRRREVSFFATSVALNARLATRMAGNHGRRRLLQE